MRKISLLVALLVLVIAGCAISNGPPLLGLKFGQNYPGSSMIHTGIDLDVPYNSPVRAMRDGEVLVVQTNPHEIYLSIDHGEAYTALYYHLGKVLVAEREKVKQGQVVGFTGRTGYSSPARDGLVQYPHLHLEIWKEGGRINPEILGLKCPGSEHQWWWPVGCKEAYQ